MGTQEKFLAAADGVSPEYEGVTHVLQVPPIRQQQGRQRTKRYNDGFKSMRTHADATQRAK